MAKLDKYECDGQMDFFTASQREKEPGIEALIPFGKECAVTRQYLCAVTGLKDRKVRMQIAQARREYPILNLSDGNGYYRPTFAEYMEAKQFYRQERARAKSIFWSLSGLKKWLKANGGCL